MSREATEYLLDASALLAVMLDEPGQELVQAILDRSSIHAVNVAEVVNKLMREGVPYDEAFTSIEELQVPVIQEFGLEQAVDCGQLIAATRKLGLGLGDCLCMTVAAWRRATAITAERIWTKLEGRQLGRNSIRIQLIR
jgi:ribonuclease VapC